LAQADRRTLAKTSKRYDEQTLLPERRPVALGVLDELVGFRDPDGATAALEPVVKQDAGDLAAFTGARAITQEPAASEADGIFSVIRRRRHHIEGVVDGP
jgi:hypothetical protein